MKLGKRSIRAQAHRIGIDLLGNEGSPDKIVDAILSEKWQGIQLVFFGFPEQAICLHGTSHQFIPVREAIAMEDNPLKAIREKKDSSLCRGMAMLKSGDLDAFISAGNTGALMASAKLALSTMPGIKRPALLTLFPTKEQDLAVLDVGANVVCKPNQLLQFAAMGIAVQKSRGIKEPRVGLLNIGNEEIKGTPELRIVYRQLQAAPFKKNFVGNIEAREVLQGHIDVLVTDGFTGNVFLKTCEGIAAVLLEEFEMRAANARFSKLEVFFDTMRRQLHYAEHPGAILCGVEKLVMKCHGDAPPQSFIRSIREAFLLLENDFLTMLKTELAALLR